MYFFLTLFLICILLWCANFLIIATLIFLIKLQSNENDLINFKKILGRYFHFRVISDDHTRYKWTFGIFTIKADFNANDNLIGNRIKINKWAIFNMELFFTT
jgi:hypothetical protein